MLFSLNCAGIGELFYSTFSRRFKNLGHWSRLRVATNSIEKLADDAVEKEFVDMQKLRASITSTAVSFVLRKTPANAVRKKSYRQTTHTNHVIQILFVFTK